MYKLTIATYNCDYNRDIMLIKKGAEAEIHRDEWHGRAVIIKKRTPKRYRIAQIDEMLRSTRTKEEAKLLIEARAAGVRTPLIYDVDVNEAKIVMEFIEGPRVKDILNNVSDEEREKICVAIGGDIAKLHKNNIIHGDLTTSNIIVKDGALHFIDFGLGSKSDEIEAKGVDLHVLMEALTSTNSEFPECFGFVSDGYSREYENAKNVLKRVDEIARRGRYAR